MLRQRSMPAVRARLTQYLRSRGRALGVLVVLGLGAHACSSRPRDPGVFGLAAWLGEQAQASVGPTDFVWGARANVLVELAWGRSIWFLGAEQAGGARDLYRARARLAPTGRPLALRGLVNVTATPDADESGLVLRAGRLAFGSVSQGLVHAVSVLDEQRPRGNLLERLVMRARFGTPFARTDLVLDAKASTAALSLGESDVRVELADTAQSVVYDLTRGTFTGPFAGIARALPRAAGEGAFRLEMLALSRAWLGTQGTAWLGRTLLGAADVGRRLLARVAPSPGSDPPNATPRYQPVAHAWLKPPLGTASAPSAPERYLSRATLRPDPRRPHAKLELVALDMRQLELGFEAGSRWPHATLGPGGDGHLPHAPERFRRVVAVFNAGPEAAYERYGTLASGRLLVLPEAGRASVVVTRGQLALLGPWTHTGEIPPDVLAFTQRRSALVRAGVGVPSADTSVRRRTALCAGADGRLVYAYAEAIDASTLGAALSRAGCDEALPLATSPERLGFALAEVTARDRGRFEPLAPGMDFDAAAALADSTRDFFYVSVRDVTPKLPEGVTWKPDGGTQPAPAWLPGIVASELRLGGITLALTSFAGGRFDFRLRPGPLELGARGQAWAGHLVPEDAARAVAALELGHATGATRYGLALGSVIPLPLRPTSATLVLGSTGTRILLPGEAVTLAAGEQAVQLPLLADDSDVTERARERGDARLRAALGIAEDGRLVVASLRHDSSDPLAVGLRAAGCRRVVELDRGSHHPAALERAGTDRPPRQASESTTLWVLGPKTE
jgi:hypothetical protein